MQINVFIIDDEQLARQRIRKLLATRADVHILGECNCGTDAITAIETQRPDLIFLDIQMKDMDGFEVLNSLSISPKPLVIFVTAYDQYALRAFDFFAFDYLLKPFKDGRFQQSLDKAIHQLKQHPAAQEAQLSELLKYLKKEQMPTTEKQQAIPIKLAGRIYFVEPKNIEYIEADGYYIELVADGKRHLIRETLKNMLAKLDNHKFIRIHRSTIINKDFLGEISNLGLGDVEVIMQDGKSLRVSKSYKEALFERLGV